MSSQERIHHSEQNLKSLHKNDDIEAKLSSINKQIIKRNIEGEIQYTY